MSQLRYAPKLLTQQLTKTLHPFYLLYGSELFLLEESATLIRNAVLAKAPTEVFSVSLGDQQNYWEALFAHQQNRSLFAENLFIEVKLPSKLSAHDNEKLVEILNHPSSETIFLFKTLQNKLPTGKWFPLLEKQGLIISHYPLSCAAFNQWILERAKTLGLTLQPQALHLLAYYTEGNCLAAAQELERLSLSEGGGERIISTIDEQSQFDVFDLSEAILKQQPQRVLKIISIINSSQATPISLVIWALAQLIRTLLDCSGTQAPELQRERLLRHGIRASAQSLYLKVLYDHPHRPATYAALLAELSSADKLFKSGASEASMRLIIHICLFLTKTMPCYPRDLEMQLGNRTIDDTLSENFVS